LLSLAPMRRPSLLLAPLAVLAVPSLAAAQAAAPGVVPVEAVPAAPVGPGAAPLVAPTEPAPLVGLDRRIAEDAAVDRAFGAPTALIAPRGTATVTLRAPIGPLVNGKISLAVTDRLELGVGTVLLADEDDGVVSAHGKLQLWRGPRAALAASLDLYRSSDPDDEGYMAMPALVASLCAGGADCRTLVNLHLTAVAVEDEDQLPILPGLSIVSGGRTQLVAEAHLFNDEETGDSFLAGYAGVRWLTGRLALEGGIGVFADLSDERYYATDDCIDYCGGDYYYEDSPEVIPWPFVGLSARL